MTGEMNSNREDSISRKKKRVWRVKDKALGRRRATRGGEDGSTASGVFNSATFGTHLQATAAMSER